jgi:hypothetical protein
MVDAALGNIMPTIITAHISATRTKLTDASAYVAAAGLSTALISADMPSLIGIPIMRPASPSIASVWPTRSRR